MLDDFVKMYRVRYPSLDPVMFGTTQARCRLTNQLRAQTISTGIREVVPFSHYFLILILCLWELAVVLNGYPGPLILL